MTENCLSCSMYCVLMFQVNGNCQKTSIFFRSEISSFASLQSEGKQIIMKTIEKGKTAFAKIGMDSPTWTDLSIPYIFSSEFSEIPFTEWKGDHNPLEIICSSVIWMGPAGSEQIAPETSRFATQHLNHHALKCSELRAGLRSDSNTFAIFGLKLYDLVAWNDQDEIPALCHILVQWHCKKIDDKPACCM